MARGAIPVVRASDGATSANVRTFAACHDVLAGDGVVAIFPEGRASDEVQLLPVKTGAARIALGSRAAGAEGLRIVPVGLIYEDKSTARARVYVRVGLPIDLDAELRSPSCRRGARRGRRSRDGGRAHRGDPRSTRRRRSP